MECHISKLLRQHIQPHLVMNSIHNDDREETILQCFSKRFKQTCSVGFLHLFFIYILSYLKKKKRFREVNNVTPSLKNPTVICCAKWSSTSLIMIKKYLCDRRLFVQVLFNSLYIYIYLLSSLFSFQCQGLVLIFQLPLKSNHPKLRFVEHVLHSSLLCPEGKQENLSLTSHSNTFLSTDFNTK